jgi:trehalose 6-phosphate phosphatase
MVETGAPPPPSLLSGAALFLDFDGTLVELAEAPDAIRVSGELAPLIARLAERLGGRLAIVSGRSIADLERHLDLGTIAVAGSHGAEIRCPGGVSGSPEPPSGLADAREAVIRFASGRDGLLVEHKPAGVALHYRQAPEQSEIVASFMSGLADGSGLSLLRGKMVAELRPPGADKGAALRAMMREPPFAGARPLFVGDDITDEDGFKAAADLGGTGILIGPPRPTAAGWRLPDVAGLARWLGEAAGS